MSDRLSMTWEDLVKASGERWAKERWTFAGARKRHEDVDKISRLHHVIGANGQDYDYGDHVIVEQLRIDRSILIALVDRLMDFARRSQSICTCADPCGCASAVETEAESLLRDLDGDARGGGR